ncbi:MAG TPA: hypothetical protein VKV17_14045 [Bryobacteraceae bacterium]|nr:hypothetical protein [Bryobacteraceae bacterium]
MQTAGWKRPVLALVLFGCAFGYVEAAVVSYLRYLHEPILHRFYPARSINDLFPLLTAQQAAQSGPRERKVLITEVGREASTIVMLAGIALAVSKNPGQWAAAFAIAFGVWDSTFYLFLKILLDWPASLATWDILFIIPVPWVAPVIAPVLVSAAMVVSGIWHLRREAAGRPANLGLRNWAGLFAGAFIIIVSFTLDRTNVSAGGMPRPFHWAVFGLGMLIGLSAYAEAALRSRPDYFAAAASSPHASGSSPESLRNSL